jgi:hypothetical protein
VKRLTCNLHSAALTRSLQAESKLGLVQEGSDVHGITTNVLKGRGLRAWSPAAGRTEHWAEQRNLEETPAKSPGV